jgi:propanol-preferring alcohol dehydrogenase
MRGSIVGTRRDLDEAIAFAVEGKVRAEIKTAPLSDINTIFANLKKGKVEGRMVLDPRETCSLTARSEGCIQS